MPVCKCFCRGYLSAEQPKWAQREYIEEMTARKAMKAKRMANEGSRGDCVDMEDALEPVHHYQYHKWRIAAVTYKVPQQGPV